MNVTPLPSTFAEFIDEEEYENLYEEQIDTDQQTLSESLDALRAAFGDLPLPFPGAHDGDTAREVKIRYALLALRAIFQYEESKEHADGGTHLIEHIMSGEDWTQMRNPSVPTQFRSGWALDFRSRFEAYRRVFDEAFPSTARPRSVMHRQAVYYFILACRQDVHGHIAERPPAIEANVVFSII